MMKRIIILLGMVMVLTGCIEEKAMDTLLSESEICLDWKGDRQITYDSKDYQLAFNDKINEYRVYDDRLANWFTVRCSEKPCSEGQRLTADVSWTGKKSTKSYTARTFKVEKVDENGLVWLLSESDRIGIIIKNIQ